MNVNKNGMAAVVGVLIVVGIVIAVAVAFVYSMQRDASIEICIQGTGSITFDTAEQDEVIESGCKKFYMNAGTVVSITAGTGFDRWEVESRTTCATSPGYVCSSPQNPIDATVVKGQHDTLTGVFR
jgi:hypothetical protein